MPRRSGCQGWAWGYPATARQGGVECGASVHCGVVNERSVSDGSGRHSSARPCARWRVPAHVRAMLSGPMRWPPCGGDERTARDGAGSTRREEILHRDPPVTEFQIRRPILPTPGHKNERPSRSAHHEAEQTRHRTTLTLQKPRTGGSFKSSTDNDQVTGLDSQSRYVLYGAEACRSVL